MHKFGLPSIVQKSNSGKSTTKSNSNPSNSLVVRVVDVILDENHQLIKDGSYGLDSLGLIIGVGVTPNTFGKDYRAIPCNPNTKNFPLIGEHVPLIQGPSPNSNNTQWFYQDPLSLFGSISINELSFPSLFNTSKTPSQSNTYTQIELGAYNVIDTVTSNKPTKIIHSLMPFLGDIIYEGRFGNSIRLGNTRKSTSKYNNEWSKSGEDGDPILIIRNGQPDKIVGESWIPITEELNSTNSLLYLTSTQTLPFKTKSLSEYSSPQAVLTSGRVVLLSKTDNIILNSAKNINISSQKDFTVESESSIITSNSIKLGADDANESVLKGDSTNELLIQLTNAIQVLANKLQYDKNWPGGVLTPSLDPSITDVIAQLSLISTTLNNGNLKSITTKVK